MKKTKLMLGDNIESLKKIPENSIDSIVTDPPYGLSFMGKKWDYDVPSVEFWKEVYRVLKPGGHVLSFGGTRTYHRMVVNIEDAGFEIRDQIMWLYGSGFPKSHNIGKAVDKRGGESIGWFGEWLVKWRKDNNIPQSKIAELFPSKTGGLTGCVSNWELGNNLPTNEQFNLICKTFDLPFSSLEEAEREFIGTKTSGIGKAFTKDGWGTGNDEVEITKGSSPYEGWGTALKPANEPICVARKPLSEKSVAENVLKWGTGGINIDGCRIGFDMTDTNPATNPLYRQQNDYKMPEKGVESEGAVAFTSSKNEVSTEGRFPANIILDETAAELLDEQSGVSKSTGAIRKKDTITDATSIDYKHKTGELSNPYAGQVGGASRFFYVAKVSKKERNLGLLDVEVSKNVRPQGEAFGNGSAITDVVKGKGNTHPTLKPINLMTYLCRLVTPEDGIVLDPFMGSGSTGIAALLEGFRFVGMEMDKEYFKIAETRIESYEEYKKLLK